MLTAVESLFTEGFLRVLKSRLSQEPKVKAHRDSAPTRSKAGGVTRALTFGRKDLQDTQHVVNEIKTNLTKNFDPNLFGL